MKFFATLLFISALSFAYDPFAQMLLEAGVSQEDVSAVLSKTNRRNVDVGMDIIWWLRRLGVRDVAKVIVSFPTIFNYSIDENLEPTIQWLKDQGVKKIPEVITLYPVFLGNNVKQKLQPKVDWLKKQGATKTGYILTKNPSILGTDISDNLQPRAEWFLKQGVPSFGQMLDRFPALSSYSLEDNIKPTWKVLTEVFGFTPTEIADKPMVIGASLARLQPFIEWAQANQIDLKKLPLATKREIVSRTNLNHVMANLEEIRTAAIEGRSVSKSVEEILARLKEKDLTEPILKKSRDGKMPKRSLALCLDAVAGLAGDKITQSPPHSR